MATLLGGRIDKYSYVLLLRNLEPIYSELEAGLTQYAGQAGIAPIYFPAMFRLHSLHRDLKSLHGPSWAGDIALLPGSTEYVKRLKAVQSSNPELLAAHAYVRYLGDLSGGQMLQKIISRSLQLAPQQGGTDFYNFGDPVEVAKLSQAFRAGLKAIGSDGVLAEAKLAFEMHGHLFDGLADACGLSQADLKTPL